MNPNTGWFETYESFNGKVLMGNNNLCNVAGIGSVKIQFHDGKIRRLTGVRHIPELTKNLISLGSLEEKGCKFQSEGGVLRVSKGGSYNHEGKKSWDFVFPARVYHYWFSRCCKLHVGC